MLILVIILSTLYLSVKSLHADIRLKKNENKCLYETTLKESLFIVKVDAKPDKNIELKILQDDSIIFRGSGREKLDAAFTSKAGSLYSFCLMNLDENAQDTVTAELEIRQGTEARDYTQIAKKEHLDPIVLRLRIIEDLLRDYHRNVLHMHSKETLGVQGYSKAAKRLIWFCFGNITIVIIAIICQVIYFKNFFKSKKII